MADKGWAGMFLQEEKETLRELVKDSGASSMSDFMRRVLRQIKSEKERLGIKSFSESDISIRSAEGG